MSRAQELRKQLWEQRIGMNESVFVIKGKQSGDYAGNTPRTVNIEDVLRSKNFVEGREFFWEGPYILHLKDDAIDRDILDHLQIAGAEQQYSGGMGEG